VDCQYFKPKRHIAALGKWPCQKKSGTPKISNQPTNLTPWHLPSLLPRAAVCLIARRLKRVAWSEKLGLWWFSYRAQFNTIQANSGNRGYQQQRSEKIIFVVSNTQGTKGLITFL
jgi:hypothetical protein